MIPSSLDDFPSVVKYLDRIGAKASGLFVATVKEQVGQYWNELARIRFQKNGDVSAPVAYEPTEEEQALIKAELSAAQWPEAVSPDTLDNLPQFIKDADSESVFVFRDVDGKILMLQLREETKDGKVYRPFTYWSDGKWRCAEPDTEKLPLYGLDTLKGNTTVFISEGAKAARAVARLIDPKTPEERKRAESFPWHKQFQYAASVGFIGGALAAERTDWSILKRYGIQRAIIIADNDAPGVQSVPRIAEKLDMPTFAIQFSDEWPVAFDLADEWPDHFFKTIDNKKYYVGPSYRDCLIPATFMTNLWPVPDKKDKFVPVLRHHAKTQWVYVEQTETFINVEMPEIQLKADSLDKKLIPFSHVKRTSDLLLQEFNGVTNKLAYRPDIPKRRINVEGERAINLYTPGPIEAKEGDATPFLEFMEYLIPDSKERHEMLRWIATLLARPERRILYGVLLISEQTGIGKTLVGEKILAPIVGHHNTSFPSEATIMEIYTGWMAQKRLAIIGEIYAGSSFKVANKLKQTITDTKVTYREMYKASVTMDNFIHIMACSNSLAALKIEDKDRRWFIPTVAEERWPDEKFERLLNWLDSGGLSIVLFWAMNFNDYVKSGQKAPSTARKTEMIEASHSKSYLRTLELARLVNEADYPLAVCDLEIIDWLSAITKERVYESPLQIRKIMSGNGILEMKAVTGIDRISYNSQMQRALLNKAAIDKLSEIGEASLKKEAIRNMIKRPSELMQWEGGENA